MKTICCSCKRIKLDDSWSQDTDPAGQELDYSHGYCPACYSNLMELTRQYARNCYFRILDENEKVNQPLQKKICAYS